MSNLISIWWHTYAAILFETVATARWERVLCEKYQLDVSITFKANSGTVLNCSHKDTLEKSSLEVDRPLCSRC